MEVGYDKFSYNNTLILFLTCNNELEILFVKDSKNKKKMIFYLACM